MNSQPPLQLSRPTRSRFASEDRAGEATFYPAGSPVPMERRPSDQPSQGAYYTDRYVEEPETYPYPYEPPPIIAEAEPAPAKKKRGWKSKLKIFSRKKKDKKVKTTVVDERPLPPTPSNGTGSLAEPPPLVIQSPGVPPSDISTSRRYELRDPGFMPRQGSSFIPRRMSITESRDESLRQRETRASGSVFGQGPRVTVAPQAEGSVFGPRVVPRAQGSVVSQRDEDRYTHESGSVFDAGPTPMLVDEKSGNRVPRDISYASTGSQPISATAPGKKKRSFRGTLKRLFTRKKKRPDPITITEPAGQSYEVEQGYPGEPYYPPEPIYEEAPVVAEPATVVVPARTEVVAPPPPVVVAVPGSTRTRSSRSSAAPPVVKTHSSRSSPAPPVAKTHSSRSSAGPPVVSPRSSHSRTSARTPPVEVVVPVSPRTSIPVRTATGSSRVYRPGSSTAPPTRYNSKSSAVGLGRRGTTSSARPIPIATPAPVPAPVLSQVTSSESPSIRSVAGDVDRSWGEVHLPAEPTPPPMTSRPGGLGLGLGGRPLAGTTRPGVTTRPVASTPRTYIPRARPARTYTAPPPRTPYVHVPRPIPPPPRYPTLPTRAPAVVGTSGLEAQVSLIVTALRDLAAEERHRTAVTENRLAEERAWNEEERQRDAELRQLVIQLAMRGGGGLGRAGVTTTRTETTRVETAALGTGTTNTPPPELGIGAGLSEFGVREQVGMTARGLGVAGTDVERLIEIMRQGHEVTMAKFQAMIDNWRRDIDVKHNEFIAEQAARKEARERRREKPIRWQPGVNIWNPPA